MSSAIVVIATETIEMISRVCGVIKMIYNFVKQFILRDLNNSAKMYK